MKHRSIILMIVLTIVTLGIYAIVWSCLFQSELKKATGLGFGGVGHFFMCIFTFGIYFLIWNYKVGGRLNKLGLDNNGLIYLILCLIGFSWLNMFFMQSQANKLSMV